MKYILHTKQMTSIRVLVCAWVVLGALQADGIVRRDDVADQEYIDLGANFPAVGLLSHGGTTRGSGVLIAQEDGAPSRWVLTAAHIHTPNTFEVGGNAYGVESFTRHPDWGGDEGGPPGSGIANDIALVELSLAVSNVTPMKWHDTDGDLGTGLEVFTVGLGLSGTGLTGEGGSVGTLRAAENTISAMGSSALVTPVATAMEYTFHHHDDTNARDLEGMAVLYDSGGPVVADFGSGNVVIGIHSYVRDNDGSGRGTYGDDLGATRVPLYDDWITETIPEPHSLVLLLGGFLLLRLFKRR